jgi:hypothetical protein
MNISSTISSWRKSLSFNSSAVQRLLILVESPTDYLISAAAPFEGGYLVPRNGTGTFLIGSRLKFYGEIDFVPFPTSTISHTAAVSGTATPTPPKSDFADG